MGARFRKSIKIMPGLKLNLNGQSVSVSAGVPGARVTLNSKGVRTTSVGLPGTGLSYRSSATMASKTSGSRSGPAHATGSTAGVDPSDLAFLTAAGAANTAPAGLKPWFSSPRYALAARILYAIAVYASNPAAALPALEEALASGVDPATDPFLQLAEESFPVSVCGIKFAVPMSRDLVVLLTIHLHDVNENHAAAAAAACHLSNTVLRTAVTADRLYDAGDVAGALTITEDLPPCPLSDWAHRAMWCMANAIRAAALCDHGQLDEAEACATSAVAGCPPQSPAVLNRALFEQATVHLARHDFAHDAQAQTDLTHIKQSDPEFPGLDEAFTELAARQEISQNTPLSAPAPEPLTVRPVVVTDPAESMGSEPSTAMPRRQPGGEEAPALPPAGTDEVAELRAELAAASAVNRDLKDELARLRHQLAAVPAPTLPANPATPLAWAEPVHPSVPQDVSSPPAPVPPHFEEHHANPDAFTHVVLAPTLKPSLAVKWQRNLSTVLYPGEYVWALAESHQMRPLIDAIAVTSRRVVAFLNSDVAKHGPREGAEIGEIRDFELQHLKSMTTPRLVLTTTDGATHILGRIQQRDAGFIDHYLRHAIASTPTR